jgi:hypothetical protein
MKRFKINPIETALVAGFALLFCHSAYQLVDGYPTIRTAMEGHVEKTRMLASVHASTSGEVMIDCDHDAPPVTVDSSTIKISGNLCHAPQNLDLKDAAFTANAIPLGALPPNPGSSTSPVKLLTSEGVPPQYVAELPLDPGLNRFRIELAYPDGTRFERTVDLVRQR